jgi:hypothetical protein
MTIKEARPYLDAIDKLIARLKAVPEHYIVSESDRSAYLMGLVDAKNAILDLVDEPKG